MREEHEIDYIEETEEEEPMGSDFTNKISGNRNEYNSERSSSPLLNNDSNNVVIKEEEDKGIRRVFRRKIYRKPRQDPLPLWLVVACDGFWDV
jgi:hypothetical protein